MHQFDLEHFRKQLTTLEDLGSMQNLMRTIPGIGQLGIEDLAGVDADAEVKRIMGMIDSMTPVERRNPALIDIPRRQRIASGSGTEPADVSGLLKQFDAMTAVIMGMGQMRKRFR